MYIAIQIDNPENIAAKGISVGQVRRILIQKELELKDYIIKEVE